MGKDNKTEDLTTNKSVEHEAEVEHEVESEHESAKPEPAKPEPVKVKEVKPEPVKTEPVKPEPVKPKREFSPVELVEVQNNSAGKLVYKSRRSGGKWVFERKGDVEYMDIQELMHMRASQPNFFKNNWIRVMDEEVIDHLRLRHFYKDTIDPESLEDIFTIPVGELEHIIDKSPVSDKILILHKAREEFANGNLTNVHVVKLIEKKFAVDLADQIE